ncbi:MAG: TIGR00282 family metallophosphoesterase [Candidatus Margulisbacteria bacterium]|nr:TIGR00282 family metallophosphoesterase [Candidatus Margulisiibacteriota bacterium]
MKILFIGDIIGKYGRRIAEACIPSLSREYLPDIIIANGENSAHGYGITEKVYKELMDMGIDVITMGNHIWDKKEIAKSIEKFPNMLRPANYPDIVPGKTFIFFEKNGSKLAVTNLLGRTFLPPMDCPFQAIEKLLPIIKKETNLIIVDVHAEATSEKCALGWLLDGKVSAVIGTHTHVMTADERILPQGAAFITDVGMVGCMDSIIGMKKDQILRRFITQMHDKFEPAEGGPGLFNAVFLEIDPASGKATAIKRIAKIIEG